MKRRTCIDCATVGTVETFAMGKNLCKKCASARAQRSKKKRAPLVVETPNTAVPAVEPDLYPVTDLPAVSIFDSRDGFTNSMSVHLSTALRDSVAQVEFHKARLDAARKASDAKSIEEASRAWQRASTQYVNLISRLSEKNDALEHIKAQAEKAKPVTFYLMQPGEVPPQFAPMREVPPEYYPDAEVADNDVTF